MFWIIENYILILIYFHLPGVIRMSFLNIHQKEFYFVRILMIQLVKRGNLAPERRSCIAAKDQHYRLFAS